MEENRIPLISVIIPTYKRSNFIKNAILNVACQSYNNIEIIIIDDNGKGSYEQKQTEDIVNSINIKQAITYFPLTKNSGACFARNYGACISKGRYLAFFDDDDTWDSNKLELQFKRFEKSSNLGFVYCFEKIVDGKTGMILNESIIDYGDGDIYEDYLNLRKGIIHTPNPLILTKAFKEVGGFDNNLPAGQDFDLFVRISKIYKIGYIPEFLHFVNIHSGERITKNHLAKVQEKKIILKKYEKDLSLETKLLLNKRIIAHSFWIRDKESGREARKYFEQYKKLPWKYRIFIMGLDSYIIRYCIQLYFILFVKDNN